jgi:hypothetical protein
MAPNIPPCATADFPWRILPLKDVLAAPVPVVSAAAPTAPVDTLLLARDFTLLFFAAGWWVSGRCCSLLQ